MARTNWTKYKNYIEPNYKIETDKYRTPSAIRDEFNNFSNAIIEKDFGAAQSQQLDPNNPYHFEAHMGQYLRYLDAAKDEYCKAVLGFYASKAEQEKKE